MIKRSLNSYMNAWTGPDFTAYPFSTKNKKDFQNLLRVYLDACFKPSLDQKDFMQEGWRWEVNPDDTLAINGVVFNEMKGAFESQNSFMFEQVFKNLFKGSEYGNCHGGEPEDIMDLTYQAFKDFHTQNYHPSNCTLISYGDINPEEYVDIIQGEYLQWFDRKDFSIVPSPPSPIVHRKVSVNGPPNMDSVRKGFDGQMSLSFLCRDLMYKENQTPEELLDYRGLQVLKILLFDFPKSPFYKRFLESGSIGGFSDMMGFDENVYYPYFSIGNMCMYTIMSRVPRCGEFPGELQKTEGGDDGVTQRNSREGVRQGHGEECTQHDRDELQGTEDQLRHPTHRVFTRVLQLPKPNWTRRFP
jgi:Zn-dependent M16 (insulinase) family peptidase